MSTYWLIVLLSAWMMVDLVLVTPAKEAWKSTNSYRRIEMCVGMWLRWIFSLRLITIPQRRRHLDLLCGYVIENTRVHVMPADTMVRMNGELSSEQALSIVGYPRTPENYNESEGWSDTAREYGKWLLENLERYFRTR